MKDIRQVVRILAILCIPLLAIGFFILIGSLALFCADVCPPDIQSTVLQDIVSPASRAGLFFDIILIVVFVTWGMFIATFRNIAPRSLWLMGMFLLPVVVVAGVVGAFIEAGFRLLPTTESQFSGWTGPVLLAWLALLPWAIVTVVAAYTTKKSNEKGRNL
jgi:hypothetical protein